MAEFRIEISHGEPVRVRVVDARHQPVANVALVLTATAGTHSEMFVGDNPTSSQTTSATGEAVFAWVPNWPKDGISVSVAEDSPWREMRDDGPKQLPDGVHQIEVVPSPFSLPSRTSERVAADGQLSGVTTGLSGLLMEFRSDDGQDESRWDGFDARCDENGRFSVRVLRGTRYNVFVNDPEWVSNTWDGVIVPSRSAAIRRPELTVTKGVPVEVHVTQGRDQKPVQSAWVHFDKWQERLGGPVFWGKTDEHGRFVARVAAGALKVRVDVGDWNLEKTVQIVEGEPAKIHLHRRYADKQTIIGRLVLPAGLAADLSNTTVTIAGMDGESKDTATVTSDRRGRFSAGISAGRVSILATSPGEEFFGCGIVDVREGVIEIPMHPTIRYEGHVVGSDDQPLPGATVRMTARLFDRGREYPPGTPDFRKQYVEFFRDRTAVTDANGYFVIPKTPQRMELSMGLTRPGETESAGFTLNYFEPGDTRPPRKRSGSSPARRVLQARRGRWSWRCRTFCVIVVSRESTPW